MRINRIKLCDFRNLCQLELTLCEHANVIYGDNGQGKTNFIEAVWMFTGAKSFRGAKDQQLVRFGCAQGTAEMDFFAGEREQSATLTIENRRSAVLNEIPLKSPTELAGHFCAVVFSPTHLSLIKNGPQEKRKFIDTSICQIKPKYIHMLSQYNRVLDQRNHLLKDLQYAPGLMDTLDIWDQRLAAFAAVVLKTRASFVQRLRPFAQQTYAGISNNQEVLDFQYLSTLECDLEKDIPEIEKQVFACLQQQREEDLRTRNTNYGPHRDDIEILLDGNSARVFGSQGQQRSCVLSLKLAECEIIKETIGEYPVVLLDDVMSELDEKRQDYLLNHLKNRQLVMTCCDQTNLRGLQAGVGIQLENGRVANYQEFSF